MRLVLGGGLPALLTILTSSVLRWLATGFPAVTGTPSTRTTRSSRRGPLTTLPRRGRIARPGRKGCHGRGERVNAGQRSGHIAHLGQCGHDRGILCRSPRRRPRSPGAGQRVPGPQRLGQAVAQCVFLVQCGESRTVDPCGIRRVIPGRKGDLGTPAGVIVDLVRPVWAGADDMPEKGAYPYRDPGFLLHFPPDRFVIGLVGFHASAGERPSASAGLSSAFDQQQSSSAVVNDRADATDRRAIGYDHQTRRVVVCETARKRLPQVRDNAAVRRPSAVQRISRRQRLNGHFGRGASQ